MKLLVSSTVIRVAYLLALNTGDTAILIINIITKIIAPAPAVFKNHLGILLELILLKTIVWVTVDRRMAIAVKTPMVKIYTQNDGLVGLSGGNMKYHKNSANNTDIKIGITLFFIYFSSN